MGGTDRSFAISGRSNSLFKAELFQSAHLELPTGGSQNRFRSAWGQKILNYKIIMNFDVHYVQYMHKSSIRARCRGQGSSR